MENLIDIALLTILMHQQNPQQNKHQFPANQRDVAYVLIRSPRKEDNAELRCQLTINRSL
jgi:hypothetical protein